MNRKQYFLKIFKQAESRFGKEEKRLASEGWPSYFQTLIATILSAQSRDETTIPIAEKLFKKYPTAEAMAKAPAPKVFSLLKSLNYNKTKSKNIIAASKLIVNNFHNKIPQTLEQLITLPGVGRKTANLYLSLVHKKQTITVDTHVLRLSNVLNLVHTKTPHQTELALQKIAPKKYWSRINRLFVLWGKQVPGKNKKKLLSALK